MTRLIQLLFISVFLFLLNGAHAQPINNLLGSVAAPSPEATSIGKYTEIDVNLSTGVPNIDLPLHTITNGSISVPISLSYLPTGIKVDEMATWVGTGWTLFTGGNISRSILGNPDENIDGFWNTDLYYASEYWDGCFSPQGHLPTEIANEVANNRIDGEQDIFTFNIPGYSGKFYVLDPNAIPSEGIKIVPKQNLRIETLYDPYHTGSDEHLRLEGFIITDPNGIQYYFGKSETNVAVDYTTFENTVSKQAPTSWHLVKVVSFDEQYEIDLSYQAEDYYYYNRPMKYRRYTFSHHIGLGSGPAGEPVYLEPHIAGQYQANTTSLLVKGNRLSQISTPFETVSFQANTSREDMETGPYGMPRNRLDAIAVQSIGGVLCKNFNFDYDYYQSGQVENLSYKDKRLRLLSVLEQSCDGQISLPYTFNYTGDFLPRLGDKAIDHWGYYNGAVDNNASMSVLNIPPTTLSAENFNTGEIDFSPMIRTLGSADRESNEDAMKEGIIQSVTYPTGKEIFFAFEANEYWDAEPATTETVFEELTALVIPPCIPTDAISPTPFRALTGTTPVEYEILINACDNDPPGTANIPILFQLLYADDSPAGSPKTIEYDNSDGFTVAGIITDLFPNFQYNGTEYKVKIYSPTNATGYKPHITFTAFQYREVTIDNSQNRKVGGLRIQQMTVSDGLGNNMVKNYSYIQANGDQSSGKLKGEPQYGRAYTYSYPTTVETCLCPCTINGDACHVFNFRVLEFSEIPQVALSSYGDYHVVYERVVEDYNGIGHKVYDFYGPDAAPHSPIISTTGPVAPPFLSLLTGKLRQVTSYNEQGSIVETIENRWERNYEISDRYYVRVKPYIYSLSAPLTNGCSLSGPTSVTYYTSAIYPNFTGWVVLQESTSTIDGLSQVTAYQYDGIDGSAFEHYNPTSISQSNMDGTYTTTYEYAKEQGISTLLGQNRVGEPVLEITARGGEVASGYRKANYSADGYAQAYYEILKDGSELLKATQTYTDRGQPNLYDPRGFAPFDYAWNTDTDNSLAVPLLLSRTYDVANGQDWTIGYEYYNANYSPFIKKITGVDEQEQSFEYDEFGRLVRQITRNGAVTTSYEYNIAAGNSSLTTTTTFADSGTVPGAPAQTVEQYFDGLGRLTKQYVNGVLKNEVIYDAFGRIDQQTYLPGTFTRFDYDDSPLKRMEEETFPDGESVRYEYGAREGHFSVIRTNERGFTSETLTDFQNRTFKTIDALDGQTEYTYTARGDIESISSPAGSYSYEYDNRYRLISKLVPGALASTYCYDDQTDLLCASVDGNKNRVSTRYDEYGREVEIYLEEDSGGVGDCNCDTAGELVLSYKYDGAEVGQESNPIYRGKMSYMMASMLGASGQAETYYTLDAYGRMQVQKDLIDISGNSFAAVQDHLLNQADWLLETDHNVSGIGPNGGGYVHRMNYDDFGRIIFEDAAGVNVEMKYNDLDQLLYKNFDGGLARQDYQYNERGWLTDINILRPEVLKEEDLEQGNDVEFCQLPIGEQETYVIEQTVDPQEFFELLCEGQTVIVPNVDECPPPNPTCLEEFADYRLEIFYVPDFVKYINENFPVAVDFQTTLASLGSIDLPGLEYCLEGSPGYSQNPAIDVSAHFGVCENGTNLNIGTMIEQDLINWLDANGYQYASVNVEYIRSTLSFEIIETNRRFTTATIGQYFYGGKDEKEFGYLSHFIDYEFRRTNVIKKPCSEDTFDFDTDAPGNTGGGLAQGGNGIDFSNNVLPPLDPTTFTFPTNLYEVILADQRKLWLFEDEIRELSGSYTIGKVLTVASAEQVFELTAADESMYLVNFPGLVNFRNINASIRDINVITMGPNPGDECPPPAQGCDEVIQAQQNASLDDICERTIELFNAGLISYPFNVAVVQLCNGDITYALDELSDDIAGTHEILNVFPVDEDGLTVQILVGEPFFAMQFAHQPNGNIEQMKWKVGNRATSVYDYSYDELDRVTGSSYWEEYYLEQTTIPQQGESVVTQELIQDFNNRYSTGFSYDAGGNVISIWRNGVGYACGPEGRIDKMTLTYGGTGGQQLTNVLDEAPAALRKAGFRPHPSADHGILAYVYDDNGNMIVDPHKVLNIDYNFLNLPELAKKGSQERLKTVYDAIGRKWQQTSTADVLDEYGDPTGDTQTETRVYINGIEYSGEGQSASRLASINASRDGRIAYQYEVTTGTPSGKRVEYYHSDHLGNVHLTFSDLNADGNIKVGDIYDPTNEIMQEQHYYPFGLTHTGPWYATVAPENAYRYNGKELDEATGLYDYGARYYDPAIARFPSIDRFAEKFAFQSPYVYAGNNPIKFIDVNGDSLKLNFIGTYAQHSENLLSGMINRNLEGQFRVIYRDVTYDKDNEIASGNLVIIPTANGGDLDKMTLNGQEFYRELTDIAHEKGTLTEIDVDYANPNVHTGNFVRETIDVADMLQFNESLTELGGTQGGKFIHEVREQYSKQVLGTKNFNTAHRMAIRSENNVNLSVRKDRGAVQTYSMGGRTVSNKIVFEKRSVINVIKN